MYNLTTDVLMSEKVRRLLRALKDGKLGIIEPTVKFDSGVEYPSLNIFFDSAEETSEALLLLSETGLLRSETVDNIAICPRCQSHRLMIRMRCPSCNSSRLVRGAMIEHLACGHIDFEERFRVEEGLFCPRCGKPLGALGSDYRTFSFLYRCLSCRSVFSSPKIEYLCDNGHVFGENDLSIRAVKAFMLNPDKSVLLERLTLDLEVIFQSLRSEGIIVESPAEVYGETGIKHDFSFAIWDSDKSRGGGEPPAIVGSMHTHERAITATDILAFWAKATDAGARYKFMVTLSGIDKDGRDLAEVYGIKIIEGRSSSEVMVKAKDAIMRVVEELRREREAALKRSAQEKSGSAIDKELVLHSQPS